MHAIDPQAARRIINILQIRFPEASPILIGDVVLRVAAAESGPVAQSKVIDRSTAILRKQDALRHDWTRSMARFQATRKEGRKAWARSW